MDDWAASLSYSGDLYGWERLTITEEILLLEQNSAWFLHPCHCWDRCLRRGNTVDLNFSIVLIFLATTFSYSSTTKTMAQSSRTVAQAQRRWSQTGDARWCFSLSSKSNCCFYKKINKINKKLIMNAQRSSCLHVFKFFLSTSFPGIGFADA